MHVERFESALWQTSSLLLVADGEAVAIDPGISRQEVEALAARAEELGARVTHVLATHADWDHVCGMAAFPDAVAAMGPLTAQAVAGGGPAELIVRRALEHDLEIVGSPRVDRTLAPGVAHRVGPVHRRDDRPRRPHAGRARLPHPVAGRARCRRSPLGGRVPVRVRHRGLPIYARRPDRRPAPRSAGASRTRARPGPRRRRGSRDRRGRPRLPTGSPRRRRRRAGIRRGPRAGARGRPGGSSRRARRRSPGLHASNVEAQLDELLAARRL